MGIKFLFVWYDLWIGVYIDREKRRVYILPLPCCAFVWTWGRKFWTKRSRGLWERDCGIRIAWEYDRFANEYRWVIHAARNPPSAQAPPGDIQPHVHHPTFRKTEAAMEYVDRQYPLNAE